MYLLSAKIARIQVYSANIVSLDCAFSNRIKKHPRKPATGKPNLNNQIFRTACETANFRYTLAI